MTVWKIGGRMSRRVRRKESGRGGAGGTWFFVQASGNGFSKYSGKMVPAGRNRPRFTIRAHCGLLVTSVSPNCCFLDGILRKSHFPAQSSDKIMFPLPRPARRPLSFLLTLLLIRPPIPQTAKIDFHERLETLPCLPLRFVIHLQG